MICLQKDYARCRAQIGLDRGRAVGAVKTLVQITWVSDYSGLHQGSGEGRRDMDRIEGCTDVVFTGLGEGRARMLPSAASSSGDQLDEDTDVGGGAYLVVVG